MKVIIDFILQNWRFFLEILLILLTFLVSIFRKKIKIESDVVSRVIRCLPFLIIEVEKSIIGDKVGVSKKTKVMDLALELYKSITGQSLSYDSYIAHQIDEAIEDILATPQKKGV